MSKQNRPPGWIHDWQPDKPSNQQSYQYGNDDIIPPSAKDQTEKRFMKSTATVPGRMLIKFALLSAGSTTLLALIGLLAYGSAGWWFPLLVGLIGLLITGFFALRRYQLQTAIANSGPRQVVGEASAIVRAEDAQKSQEDELRDFAQREGEKVARARAEYENKTAKYFPRIEAAQRSMRQLVDPSYDARWLDHDMRPTLVSFFATAAVIPITGFFTVVTAFVLLFTGLHP